MDFSGKEPLWEHLKATNKPIILYGMGNGAEKILSVMEEKGIKPSGFMASDDFVRGHSFKGFDVKKLSDIEIEYGSFIILVCFGTYLPDVMDRIKEISGKHELYAPDVPVIGGGLFDKEYAESINDKLDTVYRMLADEKSKQTFEGWVNYRITGKISYLAENYAEKSEGYDILSLGKNEVYADLGAYTGDTVEEFINVTGGEFGRIYALEPDAKNYAKLKRRLYMVNPFDLRTYNAGAWSKDCTLKFAQLGGRNSTLIPYNRVTMKAINPAHIKDIEMRSLDSIAGSEKITYIKFDVEGSERQALEGCKNIISRDKPKLCVSLYHRTEDIFDLPLLVKSLNPSYKLYLRQHPYIPAWDMNLYCV